MCLKFVQTAYFVINVNDVNRFKRLPILAHNIISAHGHTHIHRPVTESSRRSFDEYYIGIYVCAMKTNTHAQTRSRAYVEAIGTKKKEKTVNHIFLPRFGVYICI